MITPYLLYIKIAAVLLLCAALFGFGYRQGSRSVQAEWDAEKVLTLKMTQELTMRHAKEMSDLTDQYHRRNYEVTNAHNDALSALNAELAAARRATRLAGGLRVPASVCNTFAPAPKATGNSGHDAAAAGTVALPAEITDGLFDLVAEADRVTEVARSCQDWVRKQGFYGEVN